MRSTTNRAGSSVSGTSLIDSKRVEGTDVFDPAGKHIGSIKRLVLDKVSGRVVYTVASFGGFLGIGGDEYTIPWNKLNYDTSLGGYITDITEAQLRSSPDFGLNNDDDWFNRDDERLLNDYYESPYYWTS